MTELCEFGKPFGVRLAPDALSRIGIGDVLTVIATMVFAIEIIFIDIFSRRMPPDKLTPGMFASTLILSTLLFGEGVFIGPTTLPPSDGNAYPELTLWWQVLINPTFLVMTAGTAVLCTIIAFHLMNKYQAFVTPAQASVIYCLEPIFATLWAMVLPTWISRFASINYASERPAMGLFLGGALAFAGNALALWPQSTPTSNSGESTS